MRLKDESREKIAELVRSKRKEIGISQERLCNRAEFEIKKLINEGYFSEEEEIVAKRVNVERFHIRRFESFPDNPVSGIESRIRFTGVIYALKIDKNVVNRILGGI